MTQSPLDARLLGSAVIELNIARRILALYPREHSLVQASLDKTTAILRELLELRPEIALAVARDTLLLDGQLLDQKNAVFREFALALSAMSIACVSFVKGVEAQEVYDFLRFLARDPAGVNAESLASVLEEYRLRHVLLQPLDYRAFAFSAGGEGLPRGDAFLLERHVTALVEGALNAEGVRLLTRGVEPAALAGILNETAAPVHETAYENVVSSYLRDGHGHGFTGQGLTRLMDFIDGLRPELKREFLASSVRIFAAEPGALGQALEEVSVDRIIEFFAEVNRGREALPPALTTLIARFARTGVDLPGGALNVDDVLLSREIAELFRREETAERVPESYRAEIRRLVESRTPGLEDAGATIAREFEEDYVTYCHADALLTLLDAPAQQLVTREDERRYADVLLSLARRELEAGRYAQLLELLSRLDDLGRRSLHPETVRLVEQACRDPEFVASLVESLRTHGRGDRGAAAMVCARFGGAIVPELFDRLGEEERAHVRKLLLQLLAGLGAPAAAEAEARLDDPRWHVRRNALYLIGQTGARCDPERLLAAAQDPAPRVRLEAARCLVRSGHPAGVPALRALLYEEAGAATDEAVMACVSLGARALLPDLVALARRPASGARLRRRLRLVRALGLLGDEEHVRPLRMLLDWRSLLFPREAARLRSEVRRALERIKRRHAADADAAAGGQP